MTVVCTVLVVEIVLNPVAAPDPEPEAEADDSVPSASFKIPPAAPPGGEVDAVAFLARRAKASNVLPVWGALMAATMPV